MTAMTQIPLEEAQRLRTARALAILFADWKRQQDKAEQHPGSVPPEDLEAAWQRVLDAHDEWVMAQ